MVGLYSVAGVFFSYARRLTVGLLLCAVVLCRPVGAAGGVLVIDYPEYWPFFSRTASGEMTGFFYEIVTEALGRLGVRAEWRAFPWGRCQQNVMSGMAEAMITVPTKERLEYANTHKMPFYLKKLKVFTYAGNPKLDRIAGMKTLDDIKREGLTVLTYTGNGWNDTHIRSRGIKIHETPKLQNVWLMLANKRGDIVIEWPGAAWPDIHAVGVGDVVIETDVAYNAMPFHLMISRRSPHQWILEEFDRVIFGMKETGRIREIVDRYIKKSPE